MSVKTKIVSVLVKYSWENVDRSGEASDMIHGGKYTYRETLVDELMLWVKYLRNRFRDKEKFAGSWDKLALVIWEFVGQKDRFDFLSPEWKRCEVAAKEIIDLMDPKMSASKA